MAGKAPSSTGVLGKAPQPHCTERGIGLALVQALAQLKSTFPSLAGRRRALTAQARGEHIISAPCGLFALPGSCLPLAGHLWLLPSPSLLGEAGLPAKPGLKTDLSSSFSSKQGSLGRVKGSFGGEA